jgi:hypothetical protein
VRQRLSDLEYLKLGVIEVAYGFVWARQFSTLLFVF